MMVNSDVASFMNYRRLRHIRRCNNFFKILPEDVAQHSYYTTILAMTISEELIKSGKALPDTTLVIKKALFHDIDEAVTSDVPYNVKNFTPEFKSQINEVLSEIANQYYLDGTSDTFKSYSEYSKTCKDGLEGEIVGLADMLELFVYVYEEVQSGNDFLLGFLAKVERCVTSMPLYEKSDFCKAIVNDITSGNLCDFHFL